MVYCIVGFFFISIVGTILHFVYDLMNHNKILSLFLAVNESSCEHLKLAVVPCFLWAIIGICLGINNLEFGLFVALLSVCIVIPTIFYTYTHFTKKPILVVDISSFFVGIAVAMLCAYYIFHSSSISNILNIIAHVLDIIIAIIFIVFTYLPPHIFIFKDPISNKYGLQGHYDDKTYNK